MKKIDTNDPREMLTKARMQLLMAFPFFGELVMRMVMHESKTAGVGTTCVDHKGNMYYNPEWVKGFTSVQETMFELAHEVMHLVQRCTVRFPQGGNHKVWNIAADIKVDSILVDSGLKQSAVSQKNITDELMEQHRGKTTEQIYYHLIQNPDEVESFGGCPHQQGEGSEGPSIEPGSQVGERGCTSGALHGNEANAETIEKWKQHVIAAAMNAQKRGKAPAFADEFMADIRRPSVTWKEYLRRQATTLFRGRYAYPRPNRRTRAILRGASSQMVLPTRTRSPNGAVIMMDCSGSIGEDNMTQFLSECSGILRETGCKWLKVYFHDVLCYHVEDFDLKTIDKVKVSWGGTSHLDVFEKVIESGDKIGMVVAFTDLESEFPTDKPPFPVLWAVPEGYEGHDYPWGDMVVVKNTK
jgi:predicted metal-dependent peptidase